MVTHPLLSICGLLLVTWASSRVFTGFQIALYLEQGGGGLCSLSVQILEIPGMKLSVEKGKPGKEKFAFFFLFIHFLC